MLADFVVDVLSEIALVFQNFLRLCLVLGEDLLLDRCDSFGSAKDAGEPCIFISNNLLVVQIHQFVIPAYKVQQFRKPLIDLLHYDLLIGL